jgi:deoxyribodipyrimidine photo-lyase
LIEDTRIRPLNKKNLLKGEYILYWMQASQRPEYNHALEFAINQANERKQPLIVYFGLTDRKETRLKRELFPIMAGTVFGRGSIC